MSDPDTITAAAQGRLLSFIERLERLDEDRAALAEDAKGVLQEAKGEGFDTKIIQKIIHLRAQDPARRMEEEAILDLYLSAIGGL